MHSLIIGMTESGKTTLAKLLCRSLKNAGHKTAVLDPIYDPDWTVDFRCSSPEQLSEYLRTNRSVFCFVDESGQIFNDGNDTQHSWLATRSRHYGHSVLFMAQRGIQLPKTMRDQCSRIYLFTSSVTDGKIHSEEWNKPELATCNTLPQFHFFMADRYTMLKRMEIVERSTIREANGPAYNKPISTKRNRNRSNANRGGAVDSADGRKL